MKMIRLVTSTLTVLTLCASPAFAGDRDTIESMLTDFLAAADQKPAHESFWAEDLVYTSSSGERISKEIILSGFELAEAEGPDDGPGMTYAAVEVDIRLYGDTAVLAFKLVGTPADKAESSNVLYFYNTGTFLKRDDVWQVVAWQATKIPPS